MVIMLLANLHYMAHTNEAEEETLTIDQLMERLHAELSRGNWGKIDPYDFHPHGEYYDELKETLEDVFKGLKIVKE